MYDPSSNLAPLGVSPELIACAIGLRFEYVGVTVLEPFWLCPEENLALNHQTDCITSTQIWVINFDSIKSQENIFMKKILIQRQSWMLLCPEKADLCLITRLNMTRVLECVLQLLANEHTSPFLRVVRTACPGWRGSVQLAGQPAMVSMLSLHLTRQYTTYLHYTLVRYSLVLGAD